MSRLVGVAGVMCAVLAGALFGPAHAATLSIETIHRVGGQYDDFTTAAGAPLLLEIDYDDTGIVSASYTIDGYEGAFDTVSMSTFYSGSRTAYGRTPSYGVRIQFVIGDDNIPFNNIDIKSLSFLFATKPGGTAPNDPLTEAELVSFFANDTTTLATDYSYFNRYANRTRFYVGAFEGFSVLDTDGGEGAGGPDDVMETPVPAAGLLMLGGLGFIGRWLRRSKSSPAS